MGFFDVFDINMSERTLTMTRRVVAAAVPPYQALLIHSQGPPGDVVVGAKSPGVHSRRPCAA